MTTKEQLNNMMTGNPDADARIKAAYELGLTDAEAKIDVIRLLFPHFIPSFLLM